MTNPAFRIILQGDTSRFDEPLKNAFHEALTPFDLSVGDEVLIDDADVGRTRTPGESRLILVFGGDQVTDSDLDFLPTELVIPVVRDIDHCSQELPESASPFNAIEYSERCAPSAVVSAVMETLGILPMKRRVFVSYRRTEAREAALQLHDQLRSRKFSVFLDTHEIGFGQPFQDLLWHELSGCDVLLMIDTSTYFQSRWTSEEFGRAGNMRIGILRVAFPHVAASDAVALTRSINLDANEVDPEGKLVATAIDVIADELERFRARSVATRLDNMLGALRVAVEAEGGRVSNPGPMKRVFVELNKADGSMCRLVVYPAIGVPTSDLVEKILNHAGTDCAVLYDGQSLLQSWIDHLHWLGDSVSELRWIRSDNPGTVIQELLS
ncbi:MAG: toll/interleukin-1 receptor domain-containing protein [Pseudomonadota bacterium]